MALRNKSYKDVTRVLKKMGFELMPKTATAHEKWKCHHSGKMWVVTVDKHIAPFDVQLMKFMINQSGFSRREWKKCLANKKHVPKLSKNLVN
jgi:hypothetical protein